MWNTEHDKKAGIEKPDVADASKERPVAEGDLLGNFVRRTDNGFRGIEERDLIGKDVGEDEEEAEKDR